MNMLLNLFLSFLFALGGFREDFGPFFLLFDLPSTLFSLPMWGAIVPKVEIDIKHRGDDAPKLVNLEPHILRKNRKAKMVRA